MGVGEGWTVYSLAFYRTGCERGSTLEKNTGLAHGGGEGSARTRWTLTAKIDNFPGWFSCKKRMNWIQEMGWNL